MKITTRFVFSGEVKDFEDTPFGYTWVPFSDKHAKFANAWASYCKCKKNKKEFRKLKVEKITTTIELIA